MADRILCASSSNWEVTTSNRRFRIWWTGFPAEVPWAQIEHLGFGLNQRLNSGPVPAAVAVEAIVGLGLNIHWGTGMTPYFMNRLREALADRDNTIPVPNG